MKRGPLLALLLWPALAGAWEEEPVLAFIVAQGFYVARHITEPPAASPGAHE